MMRKAFIATAAAIFQAAILLAGPATAQDRSSGMKPAMTIRIAIGGDAVIATLEDSRTARDFVSLLPLTVALRDYASTEKVADLPRRLDTADAPAGFDPEVGDIAYFAPWGNLAIFYNDFRYSEGLVKLGSIHAGLKVLLNAENGPATIELVETK